MCGCVFYFFDKLNHKSFCAFIGFQEATNDLLTKNGLLAIKRSKLFGLSSFNSSMLQIGSERESRIPDHLPRKTTRLGSHRWSWLELSFQKVFSIQRELFKVITRSRGHLAQEDVASIGLNCIGTKIVTFQF